MLLFGPELMKTIETGTQNYQIFSPVRTTSCQNWQVAEAFGVDNLTSQTAPGRLDYFASQELVSPLRAIVNYGLALTNFHGVSRAVGPR